MNDSEIRNRLQQIFDKIFHCGAIAITDDLTADKVERWDSLTHLTMIAEVEQQFGIRFKLKELTGMKNTGEMIQLIIQKTS